MAKATAVKAVADRPVAEAIAVRTAEMIAAPATGAGAAREALHAAEAAAVLAAVATEAPGPQNSKARQGRSSDAVRIPRK
jgi:hypothetical protein